MQQPRELLRNVDVLGRVLAAAATAPPVVFKGTKMGGIKTMEAAAEFQPPPGSVREQRSAARRRVPRVAALTRLQSLS